MHWPNLTTKGHEAIAISIFHYLWGTDNMSFVNAKPVNAAICENAIDATQRANFSAGVWYCKVFLGLSLSCRATALSFAWLWIDKLFPFGKYWRSKGFVFSFVPRCLGLCGRTAFAPIMIIRTGRLVRDQSAMPGSSYCGNLSPGRAVKGWYIAVMLPINAIRSNKQLCDAEPTIK
jgi:hypothetical protein